jgi:hypothetical protein
MKYYNPMLTMLRVFYSYPRTLDGDPQTIDRFGRVLICFLKTGIQYRIARQTYRGVFGCLPVLK